MRYADLAPLIGVRVYSQLLGFLLAYAAARSKPVPVLIFAGVLQLIGAFFVIVPGATTPVVVRMLGAVCWGAGMGAILLTVPAAVAGALGGTTVVVVAFGIILSQSWLVGWVVPPVVAMFDVGPAFVALPMLLVALVVLMPVKAALFHEPPPTRGRSFPIVRREPVAVAFLCLIPFYHLYWLFRAHGEVASEAPSSVLLSPRAAVGMAFVPLMFPIITTTLIDALNVHATGSGHRQLRSPVGVFLWSLFFPPVGIAFVQAAMNRAATRIS